MSPWRVIYSLTLSSGLIAIPTYLDGDSTTTNDFIYQAVDDPGTNYIYASARALYKIDIHAPTLDISTYSPSNGNPAVVVKVIGAVGVVLHGRSRYSVAFVNKADFTVVKTPAFVGVADCWLTDNLYLKQYVYSLKASNVVKKFDINTWTTDTDALGTADLSAYGTANTIMNFGHFQYILTVPISPSSPLLFISKQTIVPEIPVYYLSSHPPMKGGPWSAPQVMSGIYLYYFNAATQFRSVQLVPDDQCISRDSTSLICNRSEERRVGKEC